MPPLTSSYCSPDPLLCGPSASGESQRRELGKPVLHLKSAVLQPAPDRYVSSSLRLPDPFSSCRADILPPNNIDRKNSSRGDVDPNLSRFCVIQMVPAAVRTHQMQRGDRVRHTEERRTRAGKSELA
ncbi:hypothetical protein GN956_G11620 [Arapaima gigas]